MGTKSNETNKSPHKSTRRETRPNAAHRDSIRKHSGNLIIKLHPLFLSIAARTDGDFQAWCSSKGHQLQPASQSASVRYPVLPSSIFNPYSPTALPTAPPISVKSRTAAVTIASSACVTEACAPTCDDVNARASTHALQKLVQTRSAVIYMTRRKLSMTTNLTSIETNYRKIVRTSRSHHKVDHKSDAAAKDVHRRQLTIHRSRNEMLSKY